jgi:hypothetical protein
MFGEELLDLLGLCAFRLSAMIWISLACGWCATSSARKATNSGLVWWAAVFAVSSPVRVLSAA